MQTTNNLGLKKPGAEDVVNIEDLNSNSDVLDGKFGASSGHGHTGAAGDGPKIGSGGLAAGAATDTVIGSRTVSDTTAPTGDSGTPTTLFGWLANMIKAITGGATWRTLPGMTIAAIKTILDAATNAGTASTLMKRDSSGRAQVAAPSAAADIARKDTVDAIQSNLSTHAAVGSTAHGATSAPTVSTMMARDSAGRAQVVAPSVAADIARKDTVDGAITAHKVEADPHTGYVKKSGAILTGSLQFPTNTGVTVNGKSGMFNNGSTTIVGDVSAELGIAGSALLAYRPWGTEQLPTATVGDITYYVRTDGNDNNPGTANTAAGAFRTLRRAVGLIPQTVNHYVTIYLLEGETHEPIALAGFTGAGTITIRSTSETVRATIEYIRISNCLCNVGIIGLNVTFADVAVGVHRCLSVTLTNLSITQPGSTAGVFADRSKLVLYTGTISNRAVAVYADILSEVWVDSLTGTGNTVAYTSVRGGKITVYYGTSIGWTSTKQSIGTGGVVLSGEGVINPWGDNTRNSRSSVFACSGSNFNLANITTAYKIPLSLKYHDMLSEFDTTLYRFQASASGLYQVNTSLECNNLVAGDRISIAIYKNGFLEVYTADVRYSGYALGHDHGSVLVNMTAGDYLELYARIDGGAANKVVGGNTATTYMHICRLA